LPPHPPLNVTGCAKAIGEASVRVTGRKP